MQRYTDNYEINIDRLAHFLDKYAEISNVYVVAFNRGGTQLTDFSKNEKEKESIDKLFSEKARQEMFRRVADSEIEDQAIENHAIPGIRVAASALKRRGRVSLVWLFFGVITSELSDATLQDDTKVLLQNLTRKTERGLFMKSIDILYEVGIECLRNRESILEWEVKNRSYEFSANEMAENLHRMEITTEILQYLDSDKPIEFIMQEFLHITGRFLNVGMTCVIKKREHENLILTKWGMDSENHRLDRAISTYPFTFLEGRKPSILSFDSPFIRRMIDEQMDVPFKAVISIPIELNHQVDMYACFFELKQDRTWKIGEIQFVKDTIRVLQNIMEKRIQQNSIASSYASLEEILENVGCAVLVCNEDDAKLQFCNQQTNTMFPKGEASERFFKEIYDVMRHEKVSEIYERGREKWYEVHRKQIRWVDGQSKYLFSIFDITVKKEYQHKIEQQAYTDFLTGLYNRLCCERDLARTVDDAKNHNENGALLYLDLDDFKHINDGLGHQYGDILLKNISDSFKKVEGIEHTCYRMGGDEFVIIVPPNRFYRFDQIVDDIKAIFAKPWFLKDGDYYCTMSMGIVTFPDEGESVADLIRKADIAMYEAKKSGKNRVAKYNSAKLGESNKRLDMEKNMRDATVNGYSEFQIYYQPIIDIQKEGTPCTGAEALIRWDNAELGFVSPADFIPLAEYLGLINPIGNYVLEEACKECKFWNDNGHPEYKVNVNLSVVQLLQNNIVDIVEDTLKRTGVNPHNLTLEVTESLAINDMERMKGIMRSIRQLGVRIALDDFGTGYSSLNHIREIPLDVIKVDQSFVRDLVEDDYSKSFVKMVAELAGAIGVSICVEGIEKKEQYKVLEDMKVRLVQGFYFDRPMPREEFEKKYVLDKPVEKKQGRNMKK